MNAVQRRYQVASLLCLLAALAAALSAAGQSATEAARTRGVPGDLPERIPHAGAEPGLNVALEQYGDALPGVLDALQAARVHWLRQEFRWADLEPAPGQYDWSVSDRLIDATRTRGFGLLAALVTSPAWARDAGTETAPPRDPALFAAFARAFAQRYGSRVDVYQVWDEPNIALGWGGLAISVEGYATLLEAGCTAIHAADANSVVVAAGLAPNAETGPENLSDVLFLRRLYEAGAGPYFDVAAAKPYGYDRGPYDRTTDPAVLDFSRMVLLREEMEQHGDAGKALWASHLGWNALPSGWNGAPSQWGQVDEETQAAYTAGAIERARQEWPWAGVMFFTSYQPAAPPDDPLWGFALVNSDGRPRPAFGALRDALAATSPAWTGWHLAAPAPYARFSGKWQFSELGADSGEPAAGEPLDRVTFDFYGTDLGLTVRRADYRANFYVTVDGLPANALPADEQGAYLTLSSPDQSLRVDTIPVARDLPDGAHRAEIVAVRGWGQWSLVGFSVGRFPGRAAAARTLGVTLAAAAAALAAAVVCGLRAGWGAALSAARRRYVTGSRAVQLVATALTAGLFYATAWLAWGDRAAGLFRPVFGRLDDTGQAALLAVVAGVFYFSPWLPVSLAALVVLGLLIYYRLDLGLALAVFWVPFYYLPKPLFDWAFTMSGVVIWLCAAAWAFDALRRLRAGEPPRRGRWQALDLAMLFFVVVATLSLGVSEFLREALREWRTVVLEPALLYALIRVTKPNRAALWRLADALVLSGVAVAVIGLVQYAAGVNLITAEGGVMRLRSVYGSPDNVGLFLGRIVPLLAAVALIARAGGEWRARRYAYLLALIPIAIALVLSFSRGALLLGVPAAVAVVLLLWDRRRGALVIGALAVVAVVALVVLMRDPRLASRLDPTGETSLMRVNLWLSSVAMIEDHPVLGVGLDNFLYAYRGHYIRPDAWKEPDLSHPHNVILDYAARLGLLGLAAGVLLQVAFWRAARRGWRATRGDPLAAALIAGLMGSMADFLAHGLVDNSYFLIDLAVVFVVTLGLMASVGEPPGDAPGQPPAAPSAG